MFNKKTIIGGGILIAAATIALTISSGTASSTAAPVTADQVATKLQAAGLPILATNTYTAADDPNHLLGRPDGYTSKTSFADSRIDQNSGEAWSVTLGGTIEGFTSHADAQARVDYITKMEKAMPMFGTEYDYVNGDTVLRVSSHLTPDQAASYENAAR